MSDRTYQRIAIASCPPEKAELVRDLLHEYGFACDDEENDALALNQRYYAEEAYLGCLTDHLVPDLIELAPEMVFNGWEDPKYTSPGRGRMYVPGLGCFAYTCFVDGAPTFTAAAVFKALGASPSERALLLGTHWSDEIRRSSSFRGRPYAPVGANPTAAGDAATPTAKLTVVVEPKALSVRVADNAGEVWARNGSRWGCLTAPADPITFDELERTGGPLTFVEDHDADIQYGVVLDELGSVDVYDTKEELTRALHSGGGLGTVVISQTPVDL